ncbi:50S ribosomal protein L29 [Opitutales bacterium]|jgi:large subunit ribosomal protein L29|nr:50S ribosomal protein L29 [Opitutales bacterium]MDG1173970.1 50S ribosomal protein L29 [Opitutales bacterium]
MKMSEVKELSVQEINKKLRELGDELLQLKVRKQTGQVEKPHMIKEIKRDRARLLTQIHSTDNSLT